MTKSNQIQVFDDRKVRTVWDSETEEWYFSVVDVVGVLTDSANPTDYLKKMRKRDVLLGEYIGTNCPQVLMQTENGHNRKTLAATREQMFRIIQSIPSPKAEPFKQWMAQLASTRLDQMQDPELSIEQAVTDYRRLGYSEQWINQRLRGIEIRKMLTDEWKRGGVKDQQYAFLTDIITKQWSGMKTREYKDFKGLHKESLRDNMTNVELALNMLAEASATEISQQENPNRMSEHVDVAMRGGNVAKAARTELEQNLGRSVISSYKASDYLEGANSIEKID
ncbi:MAG: Bro-N domain-containing protein [Muribaculaceae bacterium]|nr:Bro-N domain-containing protein [Muribaculaceae bacterium]